MGLDMYLMKVTKKSKRTVDQNLFYWRKANQIRNWLVEHIEEFDYDDNCEKYIVSKRVIFNLLEDIKKVLDNHELARKIMPTSSGFCFGGCEYNEWYFEQLQETYDSLNEILKDFDFKEYSIMYTEWW